MQQQKLSGKSWLKICSSRWNCSPCPPPPPEVGNWTGFMKKKIYFFKKNLATILLSTVTHLYQDLMKLWSSVMKLQWLQLDPPPPPEVGNWTGFTKKNSFFSLRKSTEKKFSRRESPSVGPEANPSSSFFSVTNLLDFFSILFFFPIYFFFNDLFFSNIVQLKLQKKLKLCKIQITEKIT